MQYIASRSDLHWLHDKANSLGALLASPTQVKPNYTGIEEVSRAVQHDMQIMRERYDTIRADMESYDEFLDTLSTRSLISETHQDRTYSSSLFTMNDAVLQRIKTQEDPLLSYVDMQR